MRKLRNGRGLSLPDQTVETQIPNGSSTINDASTGRYAVPLDIQYSATGAKRVSSLKKSVISLKKIWIIAVRQFGDYCHALVPMAYGSDRADVPAIGSSGVTVETQIPKGSSTIHDASIGRYAVPLDIQYSATDAKRVSSLKKRVSSLKNIWIIAVRQFGDYCHALVPMAYDSDRTDVPAIGSWGVTVETLHATSLQRNQRSQDLPHNDASGIGKISFARSMCLFSNIRANKHCLRRALWGSPLPFILIFICCLFNNAALAQSHENGGAAERVEDIRPLQVGERLSKEILDTPFYIYDVDSQDSIAVRLSDYEGKLLVLDFWASWCTSCLISFPKTLSLSDQFQGHVEFLYVHSRQDDVYRAIEKMRSGSRYPRQFVLSSSILNEIFAYRFLPHYVWISPMGTVVAMTGDAMVSEEIIESVLRSINNNEKNRI